MRGRPGPFERSPRSGFAPSPPNEAFRLHAALVERVVRTVVELSGLDVAERIERRLGELADRLGRPSPHGRTVPFRLTQEELAALVGTSRESANRAVRALAARGAIVVVGRGRYAVADELLDGVRP
ncbi:MAG: hypothetical protein KatS3mg013_1425 [Actinomycetota bacterium]|nr:MAG: hypothetical protein KatS3mg013_1425 [Actinomycetota bacterium]